MQKVKLGDAFYLQMGKTPARNNKDYWGGNIKWASISDLGKDKYLHTTEECITGKAVIESGIKPVPSNTIIMSFKLSIGKVAITSEEVYTNEAIMAFIDKGIYDFDIDYLYYLFSGYNWTIGTNKAVKGLTLNKATLSEKVIAFPTLTVQKAIAEKLDKVSILIEKRKQQLSQLDLLVKSQFIEMFGNPNENEKKWKLNSLDSLGEVGSSKRIFEREYVLSGVPFFRTKEIVELSQGKEISTELFISDKRFAEIKSEYGCPQKGDLLISAVGTIGVIWVVDDREFYFKDGNLLQVRTNGNPMFLKYVLEWLISDYKMEMSKGTAYAALTINALKQMQIIDVPIELQNQFARFVEQTDKSKFRVKQSLAALELLKKSLMQKYFG